MNRLDALRDLHLPEGASAWPPAPVWWLLAGLLLLLGLLLHRHWQRGQHIRRARRALRRHYQRCRADGDAARYVRAANARLKAVALRRHPEAGPLHGQAWLDFLEQQAGPGFLQGPGSILGEGPYQPPGTVAANADLDGLHRTLLRCLRRWPC